MAASHLRSLLKKSTRRESIDGSRTIGLPGVQHRGREGRVVDGVRKMLCLQTKRPAEEVGFARFSDAFSIKEIAGVKLKPRLGREDVQHTTGRRVENARRG